MRGDAANVSFNWISQSPVLDWGGLGASRAIIVDGVTLAHSIDVSDVDEITVSCYSNTSANNPCDFIYSFENIAKLESNYMLYAK